MPKTTLAGHPLHPQLIALPAGLLPFSLVMDLLHLATGKASYADAARYTMTGGYLGGLAAGAAGAADYFSLPAGGHVKRTANLHAALNLSVMGLYSLNLLWRARRSSPGLGGLLMSVVGTAGLIAGAWYGGHLVYEHGVRVQRARPLPEVPEWKPPADENLAAAFTRFEQRLAPVEGPPA